MCGILRCCRACRGGGECGVEQSGAWQGRAGHEQGTAVGMQRSAGQGTAGELRGHGGGHAAQRSAGRGGPTEGAQHSTGKGKHGTAARRSPAAKVGKWWALLNARIARIARNTKERQRPWVRNQTVGRAAGGQACHTHTC